MNEIVKLLDKAYSNTPISNGRAASAAVEYIEKLKAFG